MPSDEIEQILKRVLPIETARIDPPSMNDWQRLEKIFRCTFGTDFKDFAALMSRYRFPGEILNVSTGRTNGDDSIEVAYNQEREYDGWNPEMIPYYAIGNGDYFCLCRSECPDSSVYYYYMERREFIRYCSTFSDWVRLLPEFLSTRTYSTSRTETGQGIPHTTLSNLQNARRIARAAAGRGNWSSTITEELAYIVQDFRQAGFSDDVIRQILEQNYRMLDRLGVEYVKPAGF